MVLRGDCLLGVASRQMGYLTTQLVIIGQERTMALGLSTAEIDTQADIEGYALALLLTTETTTS